MIKHYFNLILLCVLTFNVFGQDTTYFDSKWGVTNEENATYYRIEIKTNKGFERNDYFSSNKQIQMHGEYLSINPEVKVGEFKWYHINGKLKHIGEYLDDKENGTHTWYFDNGKVEAIENYSKGQLEGEYKEFTENGKPSSETFFTKGIQNGLTKYFREDGSLHSEGQFKSGDRDGVWVYYNKVGEIIGEEEYKTEHLIEEANMLIRFPNTKWALTSKDTGDLTEYIFKREEVIDNKGRRIIPAIMIYVEDASGFEDLTVYSFMKQKPLITNGVKIDEILIHENEDYPISYKNSFWYKCHYNQGGYDHILYMVHIINKNKIGIQILMDMTKEIAEEYESEFIKTLRTIKEQ